MDDARALLRALFDIAVAAASPASCMPRCLFERPPGPVIVVGAGKAAASMAAELEQHWAPPLEGLVIVPYGHGVPCRWIEVAEAGHPVPDANGVAATRRILDKVAGLDVSDTVVCLLSGGGSALLCQPIEGVTLAEKQARTAELLKSGATIHEINRVRRTLSAVKGGKLAEACAPAHVITLIISDVPGNDPSVVASGPTVVDAASARESDVRILATSDDALQAAALRALELEDYLVLPAHRPGWLAAQLGVDLPTETRCIEELERSGVIAWSGTPMICACPAPGTRLIASST